MAEQLKKNATELDIHINSYRDRETRRRWYDLGPQFASLTRTFRTVLKGKDFPSEVDLLFSEARMAAQRGILFHMFCCRFYGGRYGSYKVSEDRQMLERYPHRKGPFSIALMAEADSDPFIAGPPRARKIERIYALTIPDYPTGRILSEADLQATGLPADKRVSQ